MQISGQHLHVPSQERPGVLLELPAVSGMSKLTPH
jgi:hypothetical protein